MTAEEIDTYLADLARIGREQKRQARNQNRQQQRGAAGGGRPTGSRYRRPARRR